MSDEPQLPQAFPRHDGKGRWNVRGKWLYRVVSEDMPRPLPGRTIGIEANDRSVIGFSPAQAYAVGMALIAAAQGPDLPDDIEAGWSGGSWRGPE